MDVEKALALVKALADGTDPRTGEVLQTTHACQQPDVVRALLVAVGLLDREARRERALQRARLTLPRNTGRTWSLEEDQILLSHHRTGSSTAETARLHDRTERAIAARLERLGITVAQPTGIGDARRRSFGPADPLRPGLPGKLSS